MKIEKLPSGSYRIRKQYKGKRYVITLDYRPTQKEALEIMTKAMGEASIHTPVTFSEASRAFLNAKSNVLSPSTLKEYIGMNNRLTEHFKEMRVSEIDQVVIQEYINELASELSPKSVINRYYFINDVMKYMNPDFSVHITLPQYVSDEPYIPTREEIQRVLDYVKGTDYEIVFKLACHGLRRSEIMAATYKDLDGDFLYINKGRVISPDSTYVNKLTKTAKSTRQILIAHDLAELMREKRYRFDMHPNSPGKRLTAILIKLGIPHFTLHDFRHFFASASLEVGIDKRTVQYMGGWTSNSRTLDRVYTHVMRDTFSDKQKAVADEISKLF